MWPFRARQRQAAEIEKVIRADPEGTAAAIVQVLRTRDLSNGVADLFARPDRRQLDNGPPRGLSDRRHPA